MTPPAGARPTGWWRCRALRADGTAAWFAAVGSPRHADDVQVDLPEVDATAEVGDDAVCVVRFAADGAQVVRLEVSPTVAPKAPPLWFLEVRESAAAPPAVNLLAFTGHGVAPGALRDETVVREVGITSADQLAAVRWYPATGEVDQVYVDPRWRRRSIATALVAAGSTLAVARGWHGFWGDGQRTELGERWRHDSFWASRAAELTHVAPPMTPGEA